MPKDEELIAKSSRAFIGLGSNIEPRLDYLRAAVKALKDIAEIVRVSSIYETVPFGGVPQSDYLNATAEIKTSLDPIQLVQHLKSIEKNLGRTDRPRWHEREIDLDLLFYNDIVLETDHLTIPHAELHKRSFVLVPMMEIAPNLLHPLLGRTISDLLRTADALDVRKTELTLS